MVTWGRSRVYWNEAKSFWGEAFAWQGAATPRVLPPVAVFGAIATVVFLASRYGTYLGFPAGPHEVAGALLGLILVARTNGGYERWWEGRRLWGGIVNQARNLALIALTYGPDDPRWRGELIRWTIAFAHVSRRTLRDERALPEVAALVGPTQAARVAAAVHMPSAVARRIGGLLRDAHEDGQLGPLAFSGAEHQRTTLMDHLGECERIRATPLPRAFSIEIRRSIVLFLLTLTFALLSKELGWVTLLLLVLVAYAILSLDLIGSALQNPFAIDNLGALPLDDICRALEGELLGLLVEERPPAEPREAIPDLSPRPDANGEPGQGRPAFHPSPSAS
jgi:ion channel-forming bestrophin family protein